MSEPTIPDDSRQRRLEEAMAEYLIVADAGRPPEPEWFLARYPDLRVELAEFLADLSALAGLGEPLLPAAALPEPRSTPEPVVTPPLSARMMEGGSTITDPGTTIRMASATGPETTAKPLSTFAPGEGTHGAQTMVALPGGTRARYFGDYELIRELGRGGMGIVYKARQISLNRPVAVKMIKSAALASDDELRRFQNEAEAVAQLNHPHIVPILEVGNHDDLSYFSMRLIGGKSLDKKLADHVANPKAAAKLLKKAAEAVHHAHQRGILHRDLKPANILLDEQGEPFVTDFGLAKRVAGDSELTHSGAILGTPAYMAPEQASGLRGGVTTASDVYSLGAVLYALLTGRAPFGGESAAEILDQVRHQAPEPPSKRNQRVPRDLEVICLKCLAKEPRSRYGSAEALAQDLGRWLTGMPITARPIGSVERLWRWGIRNPIVAGLLVAVVVALAAGTAISSYFAFMASNQAKQALANATRADLNAGQMTEQRDRANTNASAARHNLYIAHMHLAQTS
jgi:Protein kinase domain